MKRQALLQGVVTLLSAILPPGRLELIIVGLGDLSGGEYFAELYATTQIPDLSVYELETNITASFPSHSLAAGEFILVGDIQWGDSRSIIDDFFESATATTAVYSNMIHIESDAVYLHVLARGKVEDALGNAEVTTVGQLGGLSYVHRENGVPPTGHASNWVHWIINMGPLKLRHCPVNSNCGSNAYPVLQYNPYPEPETLTGSTTRSPVFNELLGGSNSTCIAIAGSDSFYSRRLNFSTSDREELPVIVLGSHLVCGGYNGLQMYINMAPHPGTDMCHTGESWMVCPLIKGNSSTECEFLCPCFADAGGCQAGLLEWNRHHLFSGQPTANICQVHTPLGA